MNECSQLQSYIARLLEGEVRQRFERHLETCVACRTRVAQAANLDLKLAAWLEAQPAPDVSEVGARRLVRVAAKKRAARPRLVLAWMGGAVMAAAAFVLWWAQRPAPGPAELTASTAVAAVDLTVLLSEGGMLSPGPASEPRMVEVAGDGRLVVRAAGDVLGLGAHSRAEVLPTESGHARVRLATGLVAVQAAHRGTSGSLSIEAGGYTVTVVGTRFSVSWDGAERLGVVVSEGQVMVVRPDGHVRMVRAGQSLHFGAEAGSEGTLAPPSADETSALERTLRTSPDRVEPEPPASVTASSPQASGAARRLRSEPPPDEVAPSDEAALPDEAAIRQWLIDGDTARAERALLARLAASPLESSSWWLLGETRRRAGQASEAVTAYRRVIELGNPSEANRARYQVALLLEERLGDAEGAITLYRAYLARSPRPLEAAAQLRLGRLLGSRGDAAARSILEELVRLHPGTPEAEQATSVLDGR
jgi:hypothetical protein